MVNVYQRSLKMNEKEELFKEIADLFLQLSEAFVRLASFEDEPEEEWDEKEVGWIDTGDEMDEV